MNNRLHFVVTGERNRTRAFAIQANTIKIAILMAILLFVFLAGMSYTGLHHSRQNLELKSSLVSLQTELHDTKQWTSEYQEQITTAAAAKEANLKITLDELMEKNQEKETMLNNALSELKSRSDIIESILKTVGIKLEIEESTANSGGPFVPVDDYSYEDLTFKVDSYLDTLRSVPLGPPVYGTITSKYGRRVDPINQKLAFHSGVDMRKEIGTPIASMADGKVGEKGYSKGNGNYVVIEHGHGFKTRYFHMQKSLVKKGDTISRGQTIGLVGNTGRSTGSHLHYEIIHNNKTLDPLKFIRIARYIKPGAA